jgi:hypothetical protein
MPQLQPDVVLVFYNPSCSKHTDSAEVVPVTTLRKTLVAETGKLQHMDSFLVEAISGKGEQLQQPGKRTKSGKSLSRALIGRWLHECDEDAPAVDRSFEKVRGALLQDIYQHMPQEGFDVQIFSSIDNDELFVCITLKDEKTIQHHLHRNRMKLQMQTKVVAQLGVDQPADEAESSPPWMVYDHRICSSLFGESCADSDFYRVFDGADGTKTIINSSDRIRIILAHLDQMVNLDFAVSNKLLVDWFPSHWQSALADLEACWGRFSLLKDLSCSQPLSLLNAYFGSRVAFLFAWNGLYSKWLLALLPVAFVFEVVNSLAVAFGDTPYWNRGSILGFGMVIVVWARIVMNFWLRQQEYLVTLWDLRDSVREDSGRSDFVGTFQESPVDRSEVVLYYPAWKSALRRFLSFAVTVAFCYVVFIVVIHWLDLFDGRLNVAASVCLAILIQTFTLVFNMLAEALTLAENHQYQDQFYNSYLMKSFILQLVNQYSAFFYIAVKQQHTDRGCPDNDCIGLLQSQLPVTLLVLSITRVIHVVLAAVKVELALWYEEYTVSCMGEEPARRSFVEKQGKFAPFRIREQIEVTVQLALTLGYILIFGGVAPRIVPMCLLVFIIQLRAAAVFITHSAHRSVPRMTMGIGPLQKIVGFLMVVGMLFTGYLVVAFGPSFRDTQMLTRVMGVLLWAVAMAVIWACVDFACSPTIESKDILESRREYVVQKIIRMSSDAAFSRVPPRAPLGHVGCFPSAAAKAGRIQPQIATVASLASPSQGPFAKEVQSAAWSDIPHLSQQA